MKRFTKALGIAVRSGPSRPRNGSRWLVGLRVLFILMLLSSLTGCLSINLGLGGRGEFEETVVYGNKGPKLLLLDIDGMITDRESRSLFGDGRESTVARVHEQLDRARERGDIHGVLLRIDSPGGTASASDEIYRELHRFKRDQQVPIVAQMMGMATSGGYYVAMSADEVYALPTTVTGSIGVIFAGVSLQGLMEKLGVEDQTITGGVHKDAGSPLRNMTAEERAHLQSVIDDLHARFRFVVGEGRPKLTAEQIKALSDGRIFSAVQANESGLIDGIDPLEDSVARLGALADLETSRVVSYHRPGEYRNNLYTQGPARPPQMNSADSESRSDSETGVRALLELPAFAPLRQPGFHYLWWPGGAQ